MLKMAANAVSTVKKSSAMRSAILGQFLSFDLPGTEELLQFSASAHEGTVEILT